MVALVLWRVLAVAVVRVVEGEPVTRRDHSPIAGAVVTSHLPQILVLRNAEVPAVAVPRLQLWKVMDNIRGRLLMPELVQRNPCPLRPALAQDGEMQCSRRDGGDAEYDTPLVFPRISGLAAQDRLIHQPVSVLGNAFIHVIPRKPSFLADVQ